MAVILLVDDDEEICRLLVQYCNRCGHTVFQAKDGRSALAIAAERTVDIAFIDQLLPDMPGREVIACLRADPRWQQVPIVAISGLGQSYLDAAVGATETLAKPFSLHVIKALVNKFVHEKGS